MKAFSLFLADLNDGQTHTELTGHLAELLMAVKAHGRAGAISIEIKIAPASKGGEVDKVNITAQSKLKLPKADARTDFFWMTEDAELSRQHPRQHALDLRDAQDLRGGLRTPTQAFTQPDADGVTPLKEASN